MSGLDEAKAPLAAPAVDNDSDNEVCSAPGKAFLIGEYGVLEGGPALVTAVDVRAHAHRLRAGLDTPREASLFVRAAMPEVDSDPLVVTTVGFDAGGRKLGLGSSAAVVACVSGRARLRANLGDPAADPVDLEDHATRQQVFAHAFVAHRNAQQGKGSGADVAASVFGGTLQFTAASHEARVPSVEPQGWPAWLHIAFFDAGAPASTTKLIGAVHAFRDKDPQAYRGAIEQIQAAAGEFIAAFRAPEDCFAQLAAAVAQHNAGLRRLEDNSGASILTPNTQRICDLASEHGLAAKPSGAGGGDLVVVFAASTAQLDAFGVQLRRQHGLSRFSLLRPHAPGLCREAAAPTCSRLPGFYKLSTQARRQALQRAQPALEQGDAGALGFGALDRGGIGVDMAEAMVENVIGTYALPMGVATNFRINGRDVLVPMCVEEASVIAAASNAAKMIRAGGGFIVDSDPPWMIAQVQLLGSGDPQACAVAVAAAKPAIMALTDAQHPRLVARGGGARGVETRVLDANNVVIHVLVDCQDAMGANLVNTIAEAIAPLLAEITGWDARLRILSNLADQRASHVVARVPFGQLGVKGSDRAPLRDGAVVAGLIADASSFAQLDPYRAATHNKGIMNGVDAVVMATGNDWRAIEASAHAYAARSGSYSPLATWSVDGEHLVGRASLPTALGVVGGTTRTHPGARFALRLLGEPSAVELGQIVAAAGVASNLAALRALATEGIQRGHMGLHARAVALWAGARGEEVESLAKRLIGVSEIKLERAEQILKEMRSRAGEHSQKA